MPPAIMKSATWAWKCADTAVRFAIIHSTFWSAPFSPRYGVRLSASARATFTDPKIRRQDRRLQRREPKVCQAFFTRHSTAGHACRVFDVGTRIADKHVSVRHLDPTKRLGIERRIRGKQSVQIEDVGGNRIDFVIVK